MFRAATDLFFEDICRDGLIQKKTFTFSAHNDPVFCNRSILKFKHLFFQFESWGVTIAPLLRFTLLFRHLIKIISFFKFFLTYSIKEVIFAIKILLSVPW